MKLYLVQHGNQNPEDIDPEEGLSEQGMSDSKKVAEFLAQSGIKVGTMYHSVKKRAKQTAEIFAEKILAGDSPEEKQGLKPMDDVKPWEKIINESTEDLMLVGHLPFMQKISSLILTGNEDRKVINFKQGGCICLNDEEGWAVEFEIIPDLL